MPIMDDIGKWVNDSVGQYNKGYFSGGVIPGQPNPAIGDDVQIKAKKGEYVIPMDVVQALGSEFFDNIVNRFHEPSDMQGQQNGMENVAIGRGQSAIPQNPEMQPNLRGYKDGTEIYGEGTPDVPFTSQDYPVGADMGTVYNNWREGVRQIGQNIGQFGQAMGGNITPQQPTAPIQITTAIPSANVAPSAQTTPTFTDANLPAYAGGTSIPATTQLSAVEPNYRYIGESNAPAGTGRPEDPYASGNLAYGSASQLTDAQNLAIMAKNRNDIEAYRQGQDLRDVSRNMMDEQARQMAESGAAQVNRNVAIRDLMDKAKEATRYGSVPSATEFMRPGSREGRRAAESRVMGYNAPLTAIDEQIKSLGGEGLNTAIPSAYASLPANMEKSRMEAQLMPYEIANKQAQSEYYKKHGESLLPAPTKEEIAANKEETRRSIAELKHGEDKYSDIYRAKIELIKAGMGSDEDANIIREIDKLRGLGLGQQSMGNRSAPKIGDIEKGFRFKGGDPTDRKNWEKQ